MYRSTFFFPLRTGLDTGMHYAHCAVRFPTQCSTIDPDVPLLLPQDDIGLEYYALGGVVVVETMAVPAAAKLVKDWTLRTETHLATEVHRCSPLSPPFIP